MATAYTHSTSNIVRTWIYLTLFFVFVIGVGYVFSIALDSPGMLFVAVLFAVFASFGSYWWSDKVVLSMTGAKEVTRQSAPEIFVIVENLAITAGLPVPRIFVIDDEALNAFATGRDPEHAVIVFTTGLLHVLTKPELEGVAAHELSHIGNRDILLSTVVVVMVGFVTILADFFRRWMFFGGNRRPSREGGQVQVIFLVIALVFSILAPIAAVLMQLAISRKRELLADASGVLLTRYPEGLASALEKISSSSRPLSSADRATAHLFISDPLKKRSFSRFFMTHPPVSERVAALRQMDGR
ncbi:MAG: M48 family metalloprotease [Candidatus Moranbacteria bacterium]|nr:M48 family metalloprotease [Candidatus Moranbacteria bacterium]